MFIRSLLVTAAAMACIATVNCIHILDVGLSGPASLVDDHRRDGVLPTALLTCTAVNRPGTSSSGPLYDFDYTLTQVTPTEADKQATINVRPPGSGLVNLVQYDVIFPDTAGVYTFRCNVFQTQFADHTVYVISGLPKCDCRNSPHPDLAVVKK